MLDPRDLRDDELMRRGRAALKDGRYRLANDLLAEYCERQIREGLPIAGPTLADYAVAVAQCGELQEAAEICHQGLAQDRRSPALFAALARVHALSHSRRKAVETIERGLAFSPGHHALRSLQEELGVRRAPPIPFLARENPWNIRLGRALERFRARRRTA